MAGKQTLLLKKNRFRPVIYLTGLFLARLILQIALYRDGFLSVAADEFSRSIIAAKWAENPQINSLADVQATWLPFEKYLNGLFLLVWRDEILTPRATAFAASCLLLIIIYLLTHYLFHRTAISVLSTLLISLQPWFVWLSGTPMLEIYYFACYFAGLLFLIVWLKERRKWFWIWAGGCLMLASGFHVQSWTYINLLNLLTLPFFLLFFRKKDYQNAARLIGYYLLSNGLIISFALIEYFYTGEIFAFLSSHTSYSKWFYEQYDVSVMEKFFYYPTLIAQNTNPAVPLALLIAVIFLVRDKERLWKALPLLVAAVALLFNNTLNVLSGPPSAAPGRYSLFYTLILAMYVSYGIYHLFRLGWENRRPFIKTLSPIIAALLFFYMIVWGAVRIPDYPRGMSTDAVEAGRRLNILLEENPGLYMVELHYWDYLGVDLTSRHYSQIIFDREQDIRNRDTLSVFAQGTEDIYQSLRIPDLQYIAVRDEEIKKKLQQIDILTLQQTIGKWSIYEVVPKPENSN